MKEKEKEERPKIRNEKRFWETIDVQGRANLSSENQAINIKLISYKY